MFLIVFSVGLMTFGLGSLGGGRVIAGKSESTFSHLTNCIEHHILSWTLGQ